MQMLLAEKGLWGIVSGTEERPIEGERQSKWDELAGKAFANICLNLEDAQLMHVTTCKSAREAWLKLEALYENKSLVNRLFLRRRFFSIQMGESHSVIEHVDKVRSLSQQLAAIGAPVTDDDLVMTLLASLPESYNNLIVALESRVDTLTFEIVVGRLLHEETKRKEKGKTSEESAFATKKIGDGSANLRGTQGLFIHGEKS